MVARRRTATSRRARTIKRAKAPARGAVRRVRKAAVRKPIRRPVRRTAVRKVARKAPIRRAVKRTAIRRPVRRERAGRVSHFFTNINVAVIEVEKALRHGDKVHVEGANTNFKQLVRSMQIDRKSIKLARTGSSVGMKVNHRARPGNIVYRLR